MYKLPGHFGEIADSRAGAWKVQEELGTTSCDRKKGLTLKIMEIHQKDAGIILKRFPLTKFEII